MSEEVKAPEGASEQVANISADGLSVQMNDPASSKPEPDVVPKKEEEKKFAGEFSSLEDLEAKYLELKKQMDTSKTAEKETKEEKPAEENKEQAPPENREDAEKALTSSNLKIEEFENEFAQNGALSEESYQKLEKAGFNRDVVNRYIEASNIVSLNMVSTIKASIGGDEQYSKMCSWAQANLSPAEVEGYNSIMNTGNVNLIRMAVQNLNYKFIEANGKRPDVNIMGRTSASTSKADDGFRSSAEMVAAMRDARYGKDSAYTNDVERRVALSHF